MIGRFAPLCVAVLAGLPFAAASEFAFRILPLEGRPRVEPVSSLTPDGVTIAKNAEQPDGDQEFFSWNDIEAVTIVPPIFWSGREGTLVIDDDGRHRTTSSFGKIKLRKGYHRFELMYANSSGAVGSDRVLQLDIKKPGDSNWSEVPPAMLKHQPDWRWPDEAVSPGFDDDGFRLPDKPSAAKPKVGIRRHSWANYGPAPERVEDLRQIPVVSYANIVKIRPTDGRHGPKNGAVLYGLFDIPEDGEYRFRLKTDGIGALTIGNACPRNAQIILPYYGDEWEADLAYGGRVVAPIKSFTDDVVVFAPRHGPSKADETSIDIPIPVSAIVSMKPHTAEQPTTLPDSPDPEESTAEDVLFAEGSSGSVRAVTGRVLGIRDNKFVFSYQGEARTVPVDRVKAVRFAESEYTSGRPPREPVLLVGPPGIHQIPARLLSHDGHWDYHFTAVGFESPNRDTSDQTFTLNRVTLRGIEIAGGGSTNLVDLTPQIASTPLFDLAPSVSINELPSGDPLRIKRTTFDNGFAIGPKTTLGFETGGVFRTLNMTLGVAGDASVETDISATVLIDGNVAWKNAEFTTAHGPVELSLNVADCRSLEIAVDYGARFQDGGLMVIGEPELVRARTTGTRPDLASDSQPQESTAASN